MFLRLCVEATVVVCLLLFGNSLVGFFLGSRFCFLRVGTFFLHFFPFGILFIFDLVFVFFLLA